MAEKMTEIIEMLQMAFANNYFSILFVVCAVLGIIIGTGKRKCLFVPALIIMIAILNPILKELVDKADTGNVYWRAFWMIPIIPVVAALPVLFVDKAKKNTVKIAINVVSIAAIILVGCFVYSYPKTTFTETECAEKLPEDVVAVGEALLELDEHPRVVSDASISTYLRQYSGKIQAPYSRSVTYGSPSALGREAYDYLTANQMGELATLMENYDYKYLVTWNTDEGKQGLIEEAGYELVKQINGYGIYRVHGVKTERRQYNAKGQVIGLTYIDEDGNPINGKEGYTTALYEYDDFGFITYEFHTNAEGKGVADNTGKAGYRREYNRWGQITKETLLGTDENTILVDYATLIAKYSKRNERLSEEYYDENGNPIIRKDTLCAKKTMVYDNDRRIIEENYYGLQGEPVLNNQGFASITYCRDKKGSVFEERTFDVEGKPTNRTNGYSIVHREYDDADRIIGEAYFDVDEKPVNIGVGYCRLVNEYDDGNNLLLSWFYDTEDNRVECGSSYMHEFLSGLDIEDKIIFISIRDEGSDALTKVLLDDLSRLGIKINLKGQFRSSYYAIIGPDGVTEDISNNSAIEHEGQIDNISYKIISAGYLVGNQSSIIIDGNEYSRNVRGLNFVIYDSAHEQVIESISFDTYTREMRVTK